MFHTRQKQQIMQSLKQSDFICRHVSKYTTSALFDIIFKGIRKTGLQIRYFYTRVSRWKTTPDLCNKESGITIFPACITHKSRQFGLPIPMHNCISNTRNCFDNSLAPTNAYVKATRVAQPTVHKAK